MRVSSRFGVWFLDPVCSFGPVEWLRARLYTLKSFKVLVEIVNLGVYSDKNLLVGTHTYYHRVTIPNLSRFIIDDGNLRGMERFCYY